MGWYISRNAKQIAKNLVSEYEPQARAQLVAFLEERFDVGVEVGKLDFDLQENLLSVSGSDFVLRLQKRTDIPPMLAFSKITFVADVNRLSAGEQDIEEVKLEGLKIVLPPKGERKIASNSPATSATSKAPKVRVKRVVADGTTLLLLTKNPRKVPLEFVMRKLTLESQGEGKAWKYTTELDNPQPPGVVKASGEFGPWKKEEPRESALSGSYTFEKADLGVFTGIGGVLDSTGRFGGVVEDIKAEGECRVPDFHLTLSGQKVPLRVNYRAIIDGTNGDVLLRPVEGTLGKTPLRAAGDIVHIEGRKGRSIRLDVAIQKGRIEDILRLALKDPKPFLEGEFTLNAKLDVPPGKVPVTKKIRVAGDFSLEEANFKSSKVQDQIDMLARKGQGKPKDPEVADVPAKFNGDFDMRNGRIEFRPVMFQVPGALVRLNGHYTTEGDALDFRGVLRLDATVSQTFRGWKRFALKPVDPLFRKGGAGTLLQIAITGSQKDVKFGLDKGQTKP
ncbi:MAG: hypothetical protein OHK0021_17190 [Bryobacter sp.]